MRFPEGSAKSLITMTAVAALLSACGSGGVNGVGVTGRVIDGYLKGAVVCLDVNDNKSCDANEPTATSGAGGAFSLNPPSNLDLSTVRLIANVPATAVDEDTGAAVGAPYQLTAPANLAVVTPLTTLALSYKDRGETWAQALQSVKRDLAITDSLFKVDSDYVAEANVKTHNVARLVAGVIQANQVQGSTNVRSIVAGLSSYAKTAFNSSTALTPTALTALVNDGAYAVRQRVFASSYTPSGNWIDELQVYRQGFVDSSTSKIYGWQKSTGDPWYWAGDNGIGSTTSPNGANFWWGTAIPFPGGFIESWVMEPGGFSIAGMGKINLKIWSSPEMGEAPRYSIILDSVDIGGCTPQATSNAILVAPRVDPNSYIVVNPSSANHQLLLSSFSINQSCNGAVSSMSQFIGLPIKTVRVRINDANKNSQGSFNAINLGPISFEP